MIVKCADERSQLKNKTKALKVLRSRLLELKQKEEHEKYAQSRRQQIGSGDRSERIRTYNYPQSRITDPPHRAYRPLSPAVHGRRNRGDGALPRRRRLLQRIRELVEGDGK